MVFAQTHTVVSIQWNSLGSFSQELYGLLGEEVRDNWEFLCQEMFRPFSYPRGRCGENCCTFSNISLHHFLYHVRMAHSSANGRYSKYSYQVRWWSCTPQINLKYVKFWMLRCQTVFLSSKTVYYPHASKPKTQHIREAVQY